MTLMPHLVPCTSPREMMVKLVFMWGNDVKLLEFKNKNYEVKMVHFKYELSAEVFYLKINSINVI